MPEERATDVLIAGQGAAGYAAALYAARYQLRTLVAGAEFGGETATGGRIENYPGFAEVDGFELMTRFKEQAERDEVTIIDADVTQLDRESNCLRAQLSDGSAVESPAVILAIGRERRTLGLDHEREWMGRGISYCSTCDAPLSQDRVVAVVGGGNAAAEGALLNSEYAERVYLLYRGSRLHRPDPIMLDRIDAASNIEVLFETEVIELLGDDGLSAVRLNRSYEGEDTLELHNLFIEIGAEPRTELAQRLGVELNPETGEIQVDRMMRTNVEGLFAAGDLTDASGPLKQTVTAAAQGAIAALSAYQYISEHGRHCAKHGRGFSLAGD